MAIRALNSAIVANYDTYANATIFAGDALMLRHYRSLYQSMNRAKMKEYFESKTIQDFKNSKKFWQFYSSTVHV